MKLKGHSPVDLIINNRKLIEKIYIVLVIFSLICVPMVGINYDLTKYLPDSSPSAQALDIMEDEFTYPGMGARHAGGCDAVRSQKHKGPYRGR